MRNISGIPRDQATKIVMEELTELGIDILPHDPERREVQSIAKGEFKAGPYTVTLERAWCYWMLSCTPEIPKEFAQQIDNLPFVMEGTKYSGEKSILGSVLRADGFAGGKTPDSWVEHYHADVLEAVRVFKKYLQEKTWHGLELVFCCPKRGISLEVESLDEAIYLAHRFLRYPTYTQKEVGPGMTVCDKQGVDVTKEDLESFELKVMIPGGLCLWTDETGTQGFSELLQKYICTANFKKKSNYHYYS